ncbi:DUF6292 family protein [Streptomyces aculeolatus]
MPVSTYNVKKPYAAQGHPAPINSPGRTARKLWDGEQTDAFHAGKPVPELPTADSDEDLLDRAEAATEIGVDPKTWDTYKSHPTLEEHLVDVKGVPHWPRRAIKEFQASRPGRGASTGRPRGSGDMIPRDELPDRVVELLNADPAITSAQVIDALGISYGLAVRTLARLRGQRIADVLEHEPALSAEAAAERLRYPVAVWRGALQAAALEQRIRAVRPYLQTVADDLADNGLAPAGEVQVQVRAGDVLAARLPLSAAASAPALVWEDRYGWRTAVSRRHPYGKDEGHLPAGDGIRYLGNGQKPTPAQVVEALTNSRRGSGKPPSTLYPPITPG